MLSSLSPTVFGAIILLGLIATKRLYDTYLGIHKIPTYGQSAPILSFLGALSFTVNAKRIIGEGYRKFTQGVFKVSTLDGWLVIVCGPRFIDEVRAAPEDTLSFVKGTHHVLSLDYTMGFGADTHGPNVLFVQQQIGRNVAELVRDIRDETAAAFSEIFPQKDDGTWSSLKGLSTCQKIVTRTTSRALVGLPLCRDKGYVQSIIDFNFALCAGAAFLHLFPEFIKPAISLLLQMLWISPLSKLVDGHLQPLISERQRELAKEEPETGSGYVDFVKWLVRRGKDSPAFITKRVQMLNLTGLHATTMHLTQTIYRLAENPTWVDALRQEIETVIDGEGWTYEAMNQLHKLDSFIEEASRLEGLGMINMHRYTLKPFMFSNGVQIPKDTYVACATHPMHLDKAIYPDADTFNPWRFSDLRTADTRSYDGSRLTTSTSELIVFGYGRHTCPARFFAVAEMKMIVAHLVLHYDVRFADESRSSRCFYATHAAVCPDVDILVRKLPMGA